MKPQAIVRRALPHENAVVRNLVQTVVDEIYGGQWAPPPLQIDEEDWTLAWVAVVGADVAGMTLTLGEWLSDLWVLRPFRDTGVGTMLLARAEAEIADRGYVSASLRLVRANTSAQRFYADRGWSVQKEFAHERLPITMLDMAKDLRG